VTPAVDALPTPLRVLLWSPKGSGLHYGGPGMTAYRLYSTADPARIAVSLAHGFSAQPTYDLFREQTRIGTVYTSHAAAVRTSVLDLPQRAWAYAQFLHRSRQWLRANASRFDIFHGLTGFQFTVNAACEAHRLGLPAIVKLAGHRADLADKAGPATRLGLVRRRRAQVAQLPALIAISRAIQLELLEYGVDESRIALIPNGVDAEHFHPAASATATSLLRAELGWRDCPTVLFVGGIIPRKRPHLLIEALADVRRRGHECQVVLAGPEHDAMYASALRRRIAELGLTEHVIWTGFTANTAPLFRASDVFCLPSMQEGMANSILEAMASGLPTIATRISGSTDLVQPDTGVLIEPTADELADAMTTYLADPALAAAHGQAARSVILTRYSAPAVLAAHERLFRRLMAGGPAAE
jgi:glycosyltransferase involved in cell wall biosynthesis